MCCVYVFFSQLKTVAAWFAATMKQTEENVAQAVLKDAVATRITLIKQLLGDADGDILASQMRLARYVLQPVV